MQDIVVNIIGTILGGLALTLILFFINEFVFAKPNITGIWETKLLITNSTFKPHIGLNIEFTFHLVQKGFEISGSGEKTQETKPDGLTKVYERRVRPIISIDGYLERRYLRKSKLYLNIVENGEIRQSRTTYIMCLNAKNNITGISKSTASDSAGIITMLRAL